MRIGVEEGVLTTLISQSATGDLGTGVAAMTRGGEDAALKTIVDIRSLSANRRGEQLTKVPEGSDPPVAEATLSSSVWTALAADERVPCERRMRMPCIRILNAQSIIRMCSRNLRVSC